MVVRHKAVHDLRDWGSRGEWLCGCHKTRSSCVWVLLMFEMAVVVLCLRTSCEMVSLAMGRDVGR